MNKIGYEGIKMIFGLIIYFNLQNWLFIIYRYLFLNEDIHNEYYLFTLFNDIYNKLFLLIINEDFYFTYYTLKCYNYQLT